MPVESTTFLQNPADIRRAIFGLQKYGTTLDLAVAFVQADWRDILSNYKGKIRLICWLSTTNTNPRAVEDLMNHPGAEVKQRHSMHCKVYLASAGGAVVGSANLSKAALAEAEGDSAGQDEAGVLVVGAAIVGNIKSWFEALWNDADTRTIESIDLDAAKLAYDRAQQERAKTRQKRRGAARQRHTATPMPPAQFDTRIVQYAAQVRHLNLRNSIGQATALIGSIKPESLTKGQQRSLVDCIVSWTRHPGSYKRFLGQPISRVRSGLQLLFDDGRDVLSRLEEIERGKYLTGLRMPSMSLLLYWRSPDIFPPYNHRTKTFLDDFKLQKRGVSSASPQCYVSWLQYATRLSQQLRLPTPGHVDRMIEQYYEDEYEG